MTGDDSDADDACQEAMIAIARSLPRFDARSSFGTWSYRVATNAALDELRRRRRRPDPGLPDEWSSNVATLDAAEQVAARMDVDAAVASLPAEFRAPVVLRDFCGLSYDEIADVLEVPGGTVRSRIARGRAALAKMLAAEGNPEGTLDRPRKRR
jgi:RNA polymerase sigma-70 factor (ECF subfamily)